MSEQQQATAEQQAKGCLFLVIFCVIFAMCAGLDGKKSSSSSSSYKKSTYKKHDAAKENRCHSSCNYYFRTGQREAYNSCVNSCCGSDC